MAVLNTACGCAVRAQMEAEREAHSWWEMRNELLKLQERKARDLPSCAVDRAIEAHVHDVLKRKLLETQRVSSFFQFEGICHGRQHLAPAPRGPRALFEEGCRCHGARVRGCKELAASFPTI